MKKLKNKTIFFTSLGCSKNLVDTQVMLGLVDSAGFKIVPTPDEAEVIVVNTCSFVMDAKEESIENILELSEYKKNDKGICEILIITGCFAQRYAKEVEKQFPEVDLFIGTGEYYRIAELLAQIQERGSAPWKVLVNDSKFIHSEYDPRINTSPYYSAWLKVSEGCNRHCTFCAIPKIRGKLRSRTVDSLIKEASQLCRGGVRELNLICQDLSQYGEDLSEENNLLNLMDRLEKVEGLDWIRLLYYYPDELSDEVIQKIASSDKVCKYLDMPVQHFSDAVLKRMNRNITGSKIIGKVEKLREVIPDIVIRTSIIVGFPGETEDDFNKLIEGVKRARFNHLGVFRYSDEEGTPAFRLPNKLSQEKIDQRFNTLYEVQKDIAEEFNELYIGQRFEVVVEGFHEETDLLIVGRHRGQAPDTDGKVIINDLDGQTVKEGDIVEVVITEVMEYDLVGKVAID